MRAVGNASYASARVPNPARSSSRQGCSSKGTKSKTLRNRKQVHSIRAYSAGYRVSQSSAGLHGPLWWQNPKRFRARLPEHIVNVVTTRVISVRSCCKMRKFRRNKPFVFFLGRSDRNGVSGTIVIRYGRRCKRSRVAIEAGERYRASRTWASGR